MKNMFGETVKPKYDVELLTYTTHRPIEEAIEDHDMETYHYEGANNYREAVKIAKEYSNKIGENVSGDYGCHKLVDVRIMCYFEDDMSSFNPVWVEYYENGKKDFRADY